MKIITFFATISYLPHIISTNTTVAELFIRYSPQYYRSSPLVYRSYQTSIYCNPSEGLQSPKDSSEIQDIMDFATKKKQTVKALGSLHSITDIICTDGIPISMSNINYTIDNEDGTATFGAGLKLGDAMTFLEQRNLSLSGIPAYGGITIGGAIGTGAHGSSLLHPTSLSDQVVGLTIIDGTGTIQKISKPKDLNAFRVHLGLLGIIIDVTLQTVPLFKMNVENKPEPESILFTGEALFWAKQYDFYQMFWFPSQKEVIVTTGLYQSNTKVPGNAKTNLIPAIRSEIVTSGSRSNEMLHLLRAASGFYALETYTALSLYTNVIGKPPIYSEDGKTLQNPATGNAWRLMSNTCGYKCAWTNGDDSIFPEESSIAFELEQLPTVMKMIKNILKHLPASFPLVGVYIRFSKQSEGLMAISSGRPTFTVEWATSMRKDPFRTSRDSVGTYQAILQTMVNEYDGRPHWGKNGLYYFTQEVLRRSTPNRVQFINAMKKFDPNGIFLNKFGRRILGLSDEVDMDPQVRHCAIQDYCVCRKSFDCAPFQKCSSFNGYPICKDFIQKNLPPIYPEIIKNFFRLISPPLKLIFN